MRTPGGTAALASLLLGFVLVCTASAAAQEMSSLSYFIGTWSCQRIFPSTGKTIASTIRFGDDGTSVITHHDDIPPNAYHAIELWGYSATDRQFNAVIQDSFGRIRDFSSPGWAGDALAWTSAAQVSPQLKNGGYVVGDSLPSVRPPT